jgi:hypothetical protein
LFDAFHQLPLRPIRVFPSLTVCLFVSYCRYAEYICISRKRYYYFVLDVVRCSKVEIDTMVKDIAATCHGKIIWMRY